MFEVIVQANPHDTQSMEILKDAYLRLGMKKEMLNITKRLAQTFTDIGQFSTAMLEYEHILRTQPDDVETIAAMGELEERMNKAARKGRAGGLDVNLANAETGTLMATSATMRPEGFNQPGSTAASVRVDDVTAGLVEDGNEALAKFLIQHRLAADDVVMGALDRVQKKNQMLPPSTLATSLIDEIVRFGGSELEALLCGILERTKFAYIPLEYYDVDRQVIRMLPDSITLSRLIVPFDVMSRTVMVATANPFDALGKDAAQQLLDYSIQWHLASPEAISKVLHQSYRLGEAGAVNRDMSSVMSAPPSANPMPNIPPAAVPLPAIKVATNSAPLQPEDAVSTGPLPDTAAFRLNK
jgi:hypothetical protein